MSLLLIGAVTTAAAESTQGIFDAVSNNDAAYVQRWLKEGGDPNLKDSSGQSLLYVATGPKGGNAVLAALLRAGANPNEGAHGYTPLMNAASWVDLTAVQLLLKHGADPKLRNSRGQVALDVVGLAGGKEKPVIQLLRQVTNGRP